MTDNLSIWNALFKTDPAHVKPITGKSYNGSSPKPQYVIMRLTEQFGPVGKGFGWQVLASEYVDGKPHEECRERLHQCRIRFWWKDDDGEHSVESSGGTKALYKTNNGKWIDDEDAEKKSLTDAITKAASWLGVAGDIFMGRWDDSKYQDELRREKAAESESDAGLAVIAAINDASTLDDLQAIWAKHSKSPVAKLAGVIAAKDRAKRRLSQAEDFGLPPVDDFPGDRVKA